MSDFNIAFEAVFPLCFLMAIGYVIRRTGFCGKELYQKMNKFCFTIFFPPLIFNTIYQSDFSGGFPVDLILFGLVAIIAGYLISFAVAGKIDKTANRRGVIIQGLYRSNFVLFGMPVAASIFGDEGLAPAAALISIVIPIFNFFAVFALEYYSGRKASVKSIAKALVTNPIIFGSIVGFFFVFTGLKLPEVVEGVVLDISQVTTPFALIILGGLFEFSALKPNLKVISKTVTGRLVIYPLIFMTASVLAGFRDAQLVVLLALFASPVATSSYAMSEHAGADSTLASQFVAVSSAFSIFSMFCWISALRFFDFI